jgi:hypothetical protein
VYLEPDTGIGKCEAGITKYIKVKKGKPIPLQAYRAQSVLGG